MLVDSVRGEWKAEVLALRWNNNNVSQKNSTPHREECYRGNINTEALRSGLIRQIQLRRKSGCVCRFSDKVSCQSLIISRGKKITCPGAWDK